MKHNMILSASGWRKIFTETEDEKDTTGNIGHDNTILCVLIAEVFAEYIYKNNHGKDISLTVATDTRPTGEAISRAIIKALTYYNINIHFLGVAAAPEIMAYAKRTDGFIYISASHNPIGHNGIKFGLSNGGVLGGKESKILIDAFKAKCKSQNAEDNAQEILNNVSDAEIMDVYTTQPFYKQSSLRAYKKFIKNVITGSQSEEKQDRILNALTESVKANNISIVADMNGSARCLSIDNSFMEDCGIDFITFNDEAGNIAHEIIPEPENLVYCAEKIKSEQENGNKKAVLGYMPDCDGDRGNIVYWNEKTQEATPISAQEVFALCVVAESAFDVWESQNVKAKGLFSKIKSNYMPKAVAVNCPTSMRIDEICKAFDISVFRAEVGEANVVSLAEKKRAEGYDVRILGEGSNGGNITYPSKVRDPLATVFAIIKLLTIKDTTDSDGNIKKGIFHIWCEKSNQEYKYTENFTLADILDTLPQYKTTGVSEERAILDVKTEDKGLLKEKFHNVFLKEWEEHKEEMEAIYGFTSYEADTTNGTEEIKNAQNWNNGNGGLKIRFLDANGQTKAFIWMRPSGTEPVFRVMCDAKGSEDATERSLLRWENSMLRKADEN